MDLRHLKTLISIAEHRSFAAAADAIGLTQSAVSLHVKALEELFGADLFDRSTRPPALNGRGRELVERAREITELCDGLLEQVGDDIIAGSLELGAVPTSLTGILPQALASLRTAHPGLRIRLTSGLSAELAESVQRGGLDAAVVSEPAQLASGLSWHPFAREPLMVIAPDGTDGKTDRELLEALPFVRFKRFAWAGQIIDQHLQDRGIVVTPGMEVDSLEAVSSLVSHGLGVSVVPKRPIREPFPTGVRAVPFGKPRLHRVAGLIERTANPKSRLVSALYGELIRLSGGKFD